MDMIDQESIHVHVLTYPCGSTTLGLCVLSPSFRLLCTRLPLYHLRSAASIPHLHHTVLFIMNI